MKWSCSIPLCKKEAVKEVHVLVKANREQVYYFCADHFKQEEKYWTKVHQQREIYDLTPKVDDRVKVLFT